MPATPIDWRVTTEGGDVSAVYEPPTAPASGVFVCAHGAAGSMRDRGMEQLQTAAERGRYLRPMAKALLALASEREGRLDRARALFEELAREFPANPVFARELARARKD